jgi:hypothetical protein
MSEERALPAHPFRSLVETKLKSVRLQRQRACGHVSILWNRRELLLTEMRAVRFGNDPRSII